MIIRMFSLLAILLLTLSVPISFVLAQDLSSDDTRMTNDSGDMIDSGDVVKAAGNDTTGEEEKPNAFDSVVGIWKATLGEKQIIMAVNQSTESLFGLAKFEGENPWNGALAGSISQNSVSFSLAVMEGETMTSVYISAALENDTMEGFFIRSDSGGKASRGEFTATMIGPDTSSYTPAIVITVPLPAAQTEQASIEEMVEANAAEESGNTAAVQESKSRFQDVTELAKGINPNILPRMAPL